MSYVTNGNVANYLENKLWSVNNFIGTTAEGLVSALKIITRDFFTGKIYFNCCLEFLRRIIWNCLPITVLTISASAFIYSVHVAPEMLRRGLAEYLGGIITLALLREGIPVMSSLALVAQYSTGITAQIGSMKVSEQLDAMKILKVEPDAYLLVPMLLAGVIGFPIMAIIGIFVGIFVNYISSYFLIDISHSLYFYSILNTVELNDLFLCLVKSSVFGSVVALISYTCGTLTFGGSKGVGISTRLSVVLNFILIVILDYLITALWL